MRQATAAVVEESTRLQCWTWPKKSGRCFRHTRWLWEAAVEWRRPAVHERCPGGPGEKDGLLKSFLGMKQLLYSCCAVEVLYSG